MTTPGETPAPPEGLAGDSPVTVPLADFVKQIATDAGYAAADRVMDLHMDTVHPTINSRLMIVEKRVDSLRITIAKLATAGILGGGSALAILKMLGGA